MATAQEEAQILATRKQIEEQQKQIEAAKRQVTPMKRVAFTPRKERESLRQYRSGLKESSRQISQQQQEFETQVARAGIGIARPEIVEQQYKQATSEIQKQVNALESGIKAKQDAIKRWEEQRNKSTDHDYRKELKQDIEEEQQEIRVLQAELGGWKSGLSGNKLDVVKKFFSGETKSIARYQEQKTAGEIRAKELNKQAKKQYEAQVEKSKQQLAAEGKTLIYDKGKWTGAYYNPGDLPPELSGTQITQTQIEQYNQKVKSEQAKMTETLGNYPVAEIGKTKKVQVGYSNGQPIYKEVPLGERVQVGFDTSGKPIYTQQYVGPVPQGMDTGTFRETGGLAWNPPSFQTVEIGKINKVPIQEVRYVEPSKGIDRIATFEEQKEYGLGQYEQRELIAKTTEQLNKEAGWISNIIKDPITRARIEDQFQKKIQAIVETPQKYYKDYKTLESQISKKLQEANKWKYEEFQKYVDENPEDKNAKRILDKWDKDTKEQGLKYYSRSKIEESFTKKPITTTALYTAGAYFAPGTTLFSLTAHPFVEKGLGGTKETLSKFDPFGIPVGGTLAEFLPGTPEGLLTDVLLLKGVGKVISKTPKWVPKAIERGFIAKGGYTLATSKGDKYDIASGLVDVGFGAGSMFGQYAYRRTMLAWDKKMVIKYSPIERANYESYKLKGKKYKMKQRPLKEQEEIRKALKEARILWKERPDVKELSFSGMDRITPDAEQELMNFLVKRKSKLIVGGTAGTQTQNIAPDLYSPHDIDIFTTRGKPEKYAKKLSKQLESAGILDYELKGAELIYKPTGKGAIEFHTFSEFLGPNIEQIAPIWRTSKAGITKTPKKVKVLAMRSQAAQKILGYYRYGDPRLKDILYAKDIAIPSLESAKRKRLAKKYAEEVPTWFNLDKTLFPESPVLIKEEKIVTRKTSGDLYNFFKEGVNFDSLLPADYKKYPQKKYPKTIYKKTSYRPITYNLVSQPYKPIKTYKPAAYKRTPIIKKPYKPIEYRWFPTLPRTYKPYKPKKTPTKPYKPIKNKKQILPPLYRPEIPNKFVEPILLRPKKKESKRTDKSKIKKKKRDYSLRITAGQLTGFVERKGKRKELWELTGFEAAR